MKKLLTHQASAAVVAALLLLELTVSGAESAPSTNLTAAAVTASNDTSSAITELGRVLLDLQQQQRESARTIEQLREQTAAARHQSEIATARVKVFEYTLTEQRTAELNAMRDANRRTLTVVGAVAVVGMFGVALLGFFLFRALRRLSDIPQQLMPALSAGSYGHPALLASEPANQQARVFGVMDQLEQRVKELEATIERRALAAGSTPPPKPANSAATTSTQLSTADADEIVTLLAKGQTLLNANQAQEALDCFDSVLRFDPGNTEALIKQGKALEKLRRFDESLESFDRALAVDGSLTVAYLSKGGVLNRLERFDEALQCYEQALRTQHGEAGGVTEPIVVRE